MIKYYNSLSWRLGTRLKTREPGVVGKDPTETPYSTKSSWLYCLTLCLLFLVGTFGFAQTVQIGSGTDTASGGAAIPVTNYVYNYSQQIVTATEITAGGGSAGDIIKIRYRATNVGTVSVWNNWTVYVGNTAKTAFSSTTDWVPTTSLTQVFSGTITPVANQWFDITFTAPFNYTGENLVVAVDENTLGWSSSPTFLSYTSTTNAGIYYRNDSTNPDPASPPTADGIVTLVPQLQLVFPSATVPNCAITHVPAAAATGVAKNPTLSWADGGAGPTSYDVYFGTATNPALVGNQAGSTYTPVAPLASNTTYYWKVVPKNTNGSATGCLERSFTTGIGFNYCTAVPTSVDNNGITNVQIGTLSNPNVSTTPYQDFTGLTPPDLGQSTSSSMTVTLGTGYSYRVRAFIDFNQDGDFNDAGENTDLGLSSATNPTTVTGSIAVPLSALLGTTRMRIVATDTDDANDACYSGSYANVEEYTVNITAPPACFAPTGLAFSAITANSATISWTASASAPTGGYDYYYATSSTAPTGVTTPNGNVGAGITTVNLSGLTSNTQYYYWVRANCGGSETSTWSPGGSFTTACVSITSFPWTESFESVTAPNLPNCWSQNDANADGDTWITYTTYGVGSSIAAGLYTDYNSGANNDYLILPRMTLTGNQRLKFFVKALSTSEPNDYRVVLSTTGNQPADFTNVLMPLTTVSSTTMTEIAPIDMSAYSGDVYIAVHVPSGGLDGYYLYVDNFTVEDNPSCISPSGLAVAFSSSTSANLSWVAPGIAPAVGYEWAFTTSITPPASGTATTGLTATIGSLLPATTYYLHVRSVCITGVDNSTWTTSAGFVPPVVTAVPWTEGFVTASLPAQWTNNSFSVGSVTATGGNPGNTIYKNLYSFSNTGNFSTPNLGTVAANQLFSFDYRLANYNSPYDAPTSGSGNVIVEVSTNYGATYATLETITNDGVAGWRNKSYSMAAYAGQNVKFRITGNVILDEDYYLAFDNFAVTALCEGTPTGGTVNVTSQSVCSGFPVAPITVTGATIDAGITFQWEESIDAGSTWANATDGTGATTLTYQPPAFAGTTILYRLKVTCTNSSQVAYSTNSEINSNPRAVPFLENFDVIENLAGWSTSGFGVGTTRGAIGNPGNNAYANIYTSTPKNIATANYGAIVAGQALVFDYQFSNYSSPYASPASGSGTLVVSVSTDCGATFTVLETISNDGISGYKNKVISLGAYVGQNVLIDFTGNRTLGDWDLSIDNVGILIPAPVVTLLDPISVCEDSESTVTITGDFFNNVSSVTIGSTETVFNVVDVNTITFTVPIGATTGQVTVTTPGGSATSAGNLTVYPFPVNNPITGPDDKVCSNGTLQLTPGGAGADWSSSNESVATVDGNGLVSGVTVGTATISFSITDFGCTSTQTYEVEVFEEVVITTQPPSTKSIQTGTTGTISVAATGSGLTYQWYIFDFNIGQYVALSNDATYSDVTTNTLSINNTPETLDNTIYYCEVSGSAPCVSVTSGSTAISVGSTAITVPPSTQFLCSSGSATFTVVTSGDVDSIVWYEDDGSGFVPVGDSVSGLTYSGEDTTTLTVSGITAANTGYSYVVEVNGPANTVYSDPASIIVSTPPVVDTVSPTSAINCLAGGSTDFVATTSGSVDGYTYLYSTTGNPGTFAPIANGTPAGATYNTSVAGTLGVTTSPATPAGVYYYQVVANGTAPCAASNAVGFTVEVANPTISGQPVNATVFKGNSTNFTVVSPTVGATYKWQRATALNGAYSDVVNSTPAGVTYSGTTTATLTVSTSAATATGSANFYRAVVAYPAACTVNSTGARLTVTDYCASVPTSNDGEGISNVTIGSTSFPIADVMYANNSGTPVNATQSTNVNFQVTFATGYTYDSHIWIDFNDDGDFIDAGELVKSGVSLGSNPTTLDLSFVMPLSAPVGVHRVRLGTADSGQATPNPCYSGTYGVTLDFAINVLAAPACAGTPTAGTATASVTDICVSGTTTLSVSGYTTGVTGITYQWYEGATAIVGATNPTYTSGTISANTTFYCKVTCTNSGLSANTNTVAINVNSPSVDSTVAASRCGTGTVDLSATPSAGATISWYADATGGAPLATGASFTTPSISTTTNYYVDASIGGTSSNAGRVAPGASDTGSTFTDWGIVFDVLVPLKLESVDLYATTGGTVNIKIMNSALTTELFSTGNVTVVAGGTTTPNVIPLNFNMVPGTGYRILVKSYTGANLVRSSSANTFPYNSTNLNVTSSEWGGTTTGSYYYFYNLKSTTGCASPRTMVTATVTAPPALTLSASSATICSGSSTTVNVSSTVGDYDTYAWSPMTGVSGSALAGYTFNPTATTSYTLTASNTASGCVNLASFAVNVDPLPAAMITPATSSVCANGSPVLLTASSTSSGAVVIGTGTNLNDQYAYPSPFSNWYGGAKHQMLYRASELTALGFVSGDIISGLAINVNSVASGFSGSLTGFSVAMGHTASNVLTSSSFIGSLTVVRTASTLTVPTSGFPANVNVPLTSTFIWNGTSNIVIQTSYSTNNGGSGAVITANSNPGFVSTNWYRADSQSIANVLSAGTPTGSSNDRPNIVLTKSSVFNYTWAPTTGLFTDAAMSIPYTGGVSATVYARPGVTTAYVATATNPSTGCFATTSANVTVVPATIWYADADADGYGNDAITISACDQPAGYVAVGGDCNDAVASIYPGATEICYDGIDQNCNGSMTDGCAIITATLRAENCGQQLTSLNQVVRGSLYSQSIPNGVTVTGYRFRVTNLITNAVRIVDRANYIFQLTYTDFAEYNTPYSVEVALRLNQEWMEVYGAACTITTPGVPNTVLAATSCGATVVQMNNIIRAVVVPSALNYEYNVALIEGGFPVATATLIRSGESFNLLQLTGIPIKFGAEYSVTIRVEVPTSTGPQWSTVAGAACSVFTPFAPEAAIEGCGGEAGITPASLNTVVYAAPIGGTTQYRFTLTDGLAYNQVYTTTSRYFKLSNFNALSPLTAGGTYSVYVEAEIYGYYYAGKDCNILVPGGVGKPATPITRTAAGTDMLMGEFKAVAYPNPFANNFAINLRSNSTTPVSIAIYDMAGRLLEAREFKFEQLTTQQIGDRYPAGVYSVIVTQEQQTQTIRVVKQ